MITPGTWTEAEQLDEARNNWLCAVESTTEGVGIALFDPREGAFPSGRLPVVAAGGAFFFAGTAILINGLETQYRSALLTLNSTMLLGSFAAVPLFLVFGERTGSSALLWLSAFVCVGFVALGVRTAVRELRRAKRR